jgi:hypothetical protein
VNAPKQFVKKPIPIEAVQWFKNGDHSAVTSPPPFCTGMSDMRCGKCGQASGEHGWIATLEGGCDGAQLVCPGDWIIKGVKGEFYPCKPDVFALTYDAVGGEVSQLPDGLIAKLQNALERALRQWEMYADADREIHGTKYIAKGDDPEAKLFAQAKSTLEGAACQQ